ncbi:MFS transporter [Siminovitchia terrae]|uniref:MFS transporter n=1 Tax=Siminovitchia terrae TaxID=1914933 RepID=A0A429X805_SIMTE|nr:MFS transporter [Siminovitchia terrae]RST59534.1 MFS transporter [Siminovitchia terrae]
MRSSIFSMILSIFTLVLIGWVLATLYDAYTQFAIIMKNPTPPWEISLSIWPFLILVLYSILLYFLYRYKKNNKEKISIWLFPLQFSEGDEREREISGEACRKAFISTWISVPIAASALVLYPLFAEQFRYFPIFIVLLILIIQILTYFFHIRKI